MEVSTQTPPQAPPVPPKKPTRKPKKNSEVEKTLRVSPPVLEGDYPLLSKPKTNKDKFELVVKWIETLQKKPYSASALIYALRELFNVHPPKDPSDAERAPKRPSSFNVEYQVDPVLGKVLGLDEKEMITRSELLKKTYALIRHTKNSDGQYEIEGSELADVFGNSPITYTQLQKLVSKYVLKPAPPVKVSEEASEAGEESLDIDEILEVSM